MEFEQARTNLIKNQLMPSGLHNENIIEAYQKLHREDFVPEDYKAFALCDTAIELAPYSHMLKPREEALLLQALNPASQERVLLLGAGSGFSCALAARLAQSVHGVEINESLYQKASALMKEKGFDNIKLSHLDANETIPEGDFDVIWATFATNMVPDLWFDALAIGGRMLAIIDDDGVQRAVLFTNLGEEWTEQVLMELETDKAQGKTVREFVF